MAHSRKILLWVLPSHVMLYLIGTQPVSALNIFLSMTMMGQGLWEYYKWKSSQDRNFPLMMVITLIYWSGSGLVLFFHNREFGDALRGTYLLNEESITLALVYFNLGLMAMRYGYHRGHRARKETESRFTSINQIALIKWAWWVGIITSFWPIIPIHNILQTLGLLQLDRLISSKFPIVAVAILFVFWLRGRLTNAQKVGVVVLTGLVVIKGLSTGWLAAAAMPGFVWILVWLRERRELPIFQIACLMPILLFLLLGRGTVRGLFWYGTTGTDMLKVPSVWVEESSNNLMRLTHIGGRALIEQIIPMLRRGNYVHEFAHLIEQTPSVIPYQYGNTYSFLFVSMIPRFLWANKPMADKANWFYQVSYGRTHERDLGRVSMYPGQIAEAYMNFGVFGVIIFCGIIGYLVGVFVKYFGSSTSDFHFFVGVPFILGCMFVQTGAAKFFGVLLWEVLVVYMVLRLFVVLKISKVGHLRPES
jgi:hypothetical protein